MKKKKLFKNKIQMIIYIILFIICILLFIVIGKMDYNKPSVSDSEKFMNLYKGVPKDNLYVFANAQDVYKIVNKKSGIILMGFPTNKWMSEYAIILNEICKEYKVDKIYYYDFLSDREENNGTYEAIIDKISDYVYTNDLGVKEIYAPSILVVKNGKVIKYFDELSFVRGNLTPDDYFEEDIKLQIYEQIKLAILEYLW